jgi:hypothetical protein
MPMRMPPKGSRKNLGKFCSVKSNRVLWYESLLEMNLMYLLDFDPDVKCFKEQPCRIHYVLDGRQRSYTPDILVLRSELRQIIEVKPASKVTTAANQRLFQAVSPICDREGFSFIVATDGMIMQQPRLDNIKALWRYARTSLRPQHQIYCEEFLRHKPSSSADLAEALEFFASKGASPQIVYSLLFWGVLDFDLMQPLGPSSSISLPVSATRST